MNRILSALFAGTSAVIAGCSTASITDVAAPEALPILVQPDGTYPVIPLEKDEIVVKVIQSTVSSLSEFPTVEEGLDHNLSHMEALAAEACSTGMKPDFLLYHEFP